MNCLAVQCLECPHGSWRSGLAALVDILSLNKELEETFPANKINSFGHIFNRGVPYFMHFSCNCLSMKIISHVDLNVTLCRLTQQVSEPSSMQLIKNCSNNA